MVKSFGALIKLDLSQWVSSKPIHKKDPASGKWMRVGALDYLSWPDVLTLLYEHGAGNVAYGNTLSEKGHTLFLLDGRLPEVHIWVEIDEARYTLCYPVIDGSNDVPMEKIRQSDIHNASQRAFVKCVAINTGLGLSMWQKEERTAVKPVEDIGVHDIRAIKRRVEERLTGLQRRGMDIRDICASLDLSGKGLKTVLDRYEQLYKFEEALTGL